MRSFESTQHNDRQAGVNAFNMLCLYTCLKRPNICHLNLIISKYVLVEYRRV